MKPSDLPTPDRFAHGTRARYVTGCRCAACREATRIAAAERSQRVKEAAADVAPNPGQVFKRFYRTSRNGKRYLVDGRACPGTGGRACVNGGAWLRTGEPVCRVCVDRAVVWNGLVSAERARKHLAELSAAGVGRRAVGAACDVGDTNLQQIIAGKKLTIRAQTERRILAVDADARSDASLVDAAPTWRLIRKLLDEGFTKRELARRLGYKAPALQLNGERILARNAARVARFYRMLMAEGEALPQDDENPMHLDVVRTIRAGERSASEIAAEFDITVRTVERIKAKYRVVDEDLEEATG